MPPLYTYLIDRNVKDLAFILPEAMVAVTFLLAMIFDFAVPADRRKTTAYLCTLGLLMSLWLTVQQHQSFVQGLQDDIQDAARTGKIRNERTQDRASKGSDAVSESKYSHPERHQRQLFSGMVIYDHYGTFFKFILLIGTIVALLLAIHARELYGRNHGEFYLLLVAVCAGGMFLVSATNLLMIYLSLEALSIVSYAMAGYLRRDRKSAEAGIKYVIYGAMASGIMIYGMSYLYGMFGTLNLFEKNGIAAQMLSFEKNFPDAGSKAGMITVLSMVFAGFLYKIAAVPFHYWSPDVYEGAPTTATGFFSVVPKAAGFAVLIRVLCAFFPIGDASGTWQRFDSVEKVIGILAILTMTIGNLAALGQSNAKRMLAYSSIAHAGYMLAGLSVLDDTRGAAAVLFYLVIYLLMNLGAFLCLVGLENIFGGSDLRQLRGAVWREPVLCVALCAFLFSLTGLPPFAGFTGKYLIMVKLADQKRWEMILFIGINSVISLYYYMKLAKAIAIDAPDEGAEHKGHVPTAYNFIALVKCAALLLFFVYFEPIQRLCIQVLEPLR